MARQTKAKQQMGLKLMGGEIGLDVLEREYNRLDLDVPFDPDNELLIKALQMQIRNRTRSKRFMFCRA